MKIERFEVKGFKNLRQSVVLDELAGVNVIHGENNVGKSNLLQAMDLLFWLIGELAKQKYSVASRVKGAVGGWVDPEEPEWLTFPYDNHLLQQRGYPIDEIFDLSEPRPIEWALKLHVDVGDFSRVGFAPRDEAGMAFLLEVKARRNTNGGVDVSTHETPENWTARRALFGFITVNWEIRSGADSRSFMLVDTHRRVQGVDQTEQQSDLRLTVPANMLLALYDAKESVEPGVFQRWELFERSMNSLGPLVDEGRFVITFNRNRGRAILALQKGRVRMPIEALGSGVQQLASLLARVLLGNSAFVAVEEPELNLRYDLQLRLRDILKDITESGLGPQQIILTSHSPAFETGECFYAMTRTPDGPTVTRRPIKEAAMFTHQHGVQPDDQRAAFGYVSSEGLLRLSEKTRQQLGVEHGGGVVLVKRDDHPYVEVLTNEQFHQLMVGEEKGE